MIDHISIQNFMRLEDCQDVPLGRLTLLVGGNGSGKSSVLKAVHWASRCASLADNVAKLSLEKMDFVPSVDFRSLAHKSTVQSRTRSEGTKNGPVVVTLKSGDDQGSITLKAQGNAAGVNVEVVGELAAAFNNEDAQTAYIPGLAGLSEHETILASPIFRRKAASGDGGAVLRQMLLRIHSEKMDTGDKDVELVGLSKHVGKIIPGVRFWVRFDQKRDAFIKAWFLTPDMDFGGSNDKTKRRPLEMAGTGLLQVTQIFAYLLALQPRLLLLDEPDAHLHQSSQDKLISALESALSEFPETQMIISTHSPRIVQVAGPSTKVVWLENGRVKDEGKSVRDLMGWGALDKDVIIFSEDDNISYLQSIIEQWPDLASRTVIWPCFGLRSIHDGERLATLRERLGLKIMVHRDRDFMNDAEIEIWRDKRCYNANNIPVWVTPGSDIESCFQTAEHIAKALDIDVALAERGIAYALEEINCDDVRAKFAEAYNAAVKELPGRSDAIGRWQVLGEFGPKTIKGKDFRKPLKQGLKRALTEADQARRLGRADQIYQGNKDEPICVDLREMMKLLPGVAESDRVLADPASEA